jgi:two-component system, OmpR family, heavy metal sensor histidine kinase CusS
MTRFRTLRGRLTALAVLAAFLALAALTVAFNVLLARSLDADAEQRLRVQAAAAATMVHRTNGRLTVQEQPGSPDDEAIDRGVWIYEGRRALVRAQGEGRLGRHADAMAGRANVFVDVLGDDFRMFASPLTADGRQVGTVVTAEPLEAYERTREVALLGSLALAGVLLTTVFALTWVTVGRALDPVREMTRSAAEWGERDLGRRFGPKPRPDELGELATTFDGLLDRLAASLRHEQRLSAELSHELRTPLARVMAEVQLLQRRERSEPERREALAAIARNADQMHRILDMLMTAARAEAHLDRGRGDVGEALARIADEWAEPAGDAPVTLDVRAPAEPLVAGVDEAVVERIVAPLLENATRHARSQIVLSAERTDGRVVVRVADDGPGVPADQRETVFEPGTTAARPNGHGGAGLGLALARRLAHAAGGDVTLAPGAPGAGAEFRVDLPG